MSFHKIIFSVFYRANGIDKIFKFDPKDAPQKHHQLVYFIPSNLLTFKSILDQIHSYNNFKVPRGVEMKNYHVIFFPIVLKSYERLLEEEGLHGIISLHKFQWDFLTLDVGILSLEVPQVFREIFVKNDFSLLGSISHSFRLLNVVAGKPKIIITYGENSERILNMVHKMETFQKPVLNSSQNCDFSAMIIIDRNKDYPSCFLTPVVYAGLLSELFNIKSGMIHTDPLVNRLKSGRLDFLEIRDQPSGSQRKDLGNIKLNSNLDNIYNNYKYTHFSEVISNLSAQAKLLGVEKEQTKNMKINEMKEFVANKLQKVAIQKKELFKHLILCEIIMSELGANFEKLQDIEDGMISNGSRKTVLSQIKDILNTSPHKFNTLRTLCLFHITMGLGSDECANIIRNYCNAFGLQYMSLFANLSSAKLLPDIVTSSKSNIISNISLPSSISIPKFQNAFQLDANKLKLLPSESEQLSKKNQLCPSYVFNGIYIPLIAQLSNIILQVQNFDDLNSKIGHIDEIKMGGTSINSPCNLQSFKDVAIGLKKSSTNSNIFPLKPRTIFVFVVGGITYAEIAACNLIEKLTSSKIVVSSNCILTGGDIISNFID